MPTDPVCQMDVDERLAAGQSMYEGTTYYWCSPPRQETFKKDPNRYLPKTADLLSRKMPADR